MINKILFTLLGYKKSSLVVIIFLIFIGSLFELLSLGIILPIISIFTDNSHNFFLLSYIQSVFGFINEDNLIFAIIALFFLIFFLRSIFLIYLSLKINNFIYLSGRFISQKLLKIYLSKKYNWHTENNKSYFINLMTNDTLNFSSNGLYGFLFLCSELFFFISIIIFLILFNPQIFILIVILGAIFFPSLMFLTKKFSFKLGFERQKLESEILLKLNEGLHGIKEMILYNWGYRLKENYSNLSLRLARISATHTSLQDIGRYIIELSGVILVIVFLFVLTNTQFDQGQSGLATAAIFGAAIFKLMPILNRISTYTQRFRFGMASLDKISEFLKNKENINIKNTIKFEKSIKFEKIYHKFNGTNDFILKDVNLEIKKNEIVGICGESGSGKTTLTNIIMGLIEPTNGKLLIDSLDIKEKNLTAQNQISFVPQNFLSFDTSLINNITFFEENIDYKKLRFCLKYSLLGKVITTRKISLKSNLGDNALKISGGQLQRVNIARALYRDPKILILDEPTSALDKENQILFSGIINKLREKMTIIIISHNLELLDVCDSKYVLKENKLKKI